MAKRVMVKCEDTEWCVRCEKYILEGEWYWDDPEVTHKDEATCAAALPCVTYPEERIPWQARWPRLERVGTLLEAHPYRFARTMPKVPHCYTLRREWAPGLMADVVDEIHRLGEPRNWYKSTYWYLDVNEHYYWQMEDREAPPECTTLINRAVRADYNAPDPTWWPNGSRKTVQPMLALHAGPVANATVLDVGCGWPDVLMHEVSHYTAIGSACDLTIPISLRTMAIPTTVSWFVPREPRRFDVIVCGCASLLQAHEIERLPSLLAPGGRLVLVFAAKRRWRLGVGMWRPAVWTRPGTIVREGSHVVVVYETSMEGVF